MQFISNKTKVLTLFWDESYHNTSVYNINKKKYKSTLTASILSHIQKHVSNFHLCKLFTIKVYMPTVQFAEVPNKYSVFNNCCVYTIMVI